VKSNHDIFLRFSFENFFQLEREFENEMNRQRQFVDVDQEPNNSLEIPAIDAGINSTVSRAEKGRPHKIAW
jgi:hypothetical protein